MLSTSHELVILLYKGKKNNAKTKKIHYLDTSWYIMWKNGRQNSIRKQLLVFEAFVYSLMNFRTNQRISAISSGRFRKTSEYHCGWTKNKAQ